MFCGGGQVYKMHLVEGRAASGPAVDSARQNLASTFVNAFVNAGFGTDKLMTGEPRRGDGELCYYSNSPLAKCFVWLIECVRLQLCHVSCCHERFHRRLGQLNKYPGYERCAGGAEEDPGTVHWIFKNKDQGKTAAAASLGLISLWDVEGGLPQIDKFLYSKDPHVVAGALPQLLFCGSFSAGYLQVGAPSGTRMQ